MLDYTADESLGSIRLIATDLDGTLLADDGSMPPDLPELIDELDRAGIVFCAASGRPYHALAELFEGRRDEMAFLSENGAYTTYRGQAVVKELLEPAVWRGVLAACIERGRGIPIASAIDAAYLRRCDAAYEDEVRYFNRHVTLVDSFETLDAEVDKVTIFCPDHDAKQFHDEVLNPLYGDRYAVTVAGADWVDLMQPGMNKGVGLARLCERLGIDIADAAAFGDNYNDAEMLQVAGHSFVMASAAEPIRAFARYLAPTNNDRGVAQVIRAILAARRGA